MKKCEKKIGYEMQKMNVRRMKYENKKNKEERDDGSYTEKGEKKLERRTCKDELTDENENRSKVIKNNVALKLQVKYTKRM